MARSMSPDLWLDSDAFRRIRPDAANIRRAHSLRESMVNELRISLKTEVAIGMTQARIALRSGNPKESSRYTAIARAAYDNAIRLRQRTRPADIQEFSAELGRLKALLRHLGERV